MKHFCSLLLRRAPLAALWLVLLWLAGPAARAQAPAWQMATVFAPANAGTYSSAVNATATDAAGNVYVAGSFSGTATFGTTTLTSAGNGTDVFVAKYTPGSGSLVWVRQAGSANNNDVAIGIAVSGGNVYLVGSFAGTATFGSTTFTSQTASNDAFVAKLTDAGTFVWAQAYGGYFADQAYSVAVSAGGVYVAGSFAGTAFFGGSTLNSLGSYDAFVVKVLDAGATASVAWAQRAGGVDTDAATSVALSGGNVYLAGYFAGAAGFGTTNLSSVGNSDVFVAKLVDAGPTSAFAWALRAGGAYRDDASAVAAVGTSVYLTGTFASRTAGFGSTTLTNVVTTGPSTSSTDVFVAKLADAGTTGAFVWARQAGGNDLDYASGLAVRGANVYIVGTFFSAAPTFGAATVANTGSADVFVAKLVDAGPSGAFAWAQGGGSTAIDNGTAVALSGNAVYVAGVIGTPATFGALTVLSGVGNYLGCLAALTDPTLTAAAAKGDLRFSLAPNPARATATVQLPAGSVPATLTLTDALGRPVRTQTAAPGALVELDLRGLAPGLYAVRVQAGARTGTQRLVVE